MKNFNIYNINSKNLDQFINQLLELENLCFSSPWSKKSFYESCSNPSYKILAAINDQNILLGYIGCYEIFDEISITNIAVFPSFRKMGVGSQLLLELINYSSSSSANSIYLEVRKSNENAIKLYKKLNFKNIGIRKNFYEKPTEDALIFTLNLK